MDRGVKALVSGCLAFIVVTTVSQLLDGEGDRIDALAIGGVTGGAVALGIWITRNG